MTTQDTTAMWPNLISIDSMSSTTNPPQALKRAEPTTSALTLGHLTWQPETNQVQLHLAFEMDFLAYHSAGLLQISASIFNDKLEINIPKTHQPGIYFDEANSQFFMEGKPLPDSLLTELEHDLLKYLYRNVERACTYRQIATNVWRGWAARNTITKNISKLRQKLRKISPTPQKGYIETCRGHRQGYMLRRG